MPRTRSPSRSTAATASAARGTSARAFPTRRTTSASPATDERRRARGLASRARTSRVLDNWGDLIGLKGSGSHSVDVEDALDPGAPRDHLRGVRRVRRHHDPRLRAARQPHVRRGASCAFAMGELNSVQVGNAQAAVDEFERHHHRAQDVDAERRRRSLARREHGLPALPRARARLHGRRVLDRRALRRAVPRARPARRWRRATRSARSAASGSTVS